MVGERISQLRRSRNMTQKELAQLLSVSPSAIGMYEQGRRQPSAELIVGICDAFSVSTQWLLTGHPYTRKDLQEDLSTILHLLPVQEAPAQDAAISPELLEQLDHLLKSLPPST